MTVHHRCYEKSASCAINVHPRLGPCDSSGKSGLRVASNGTVKLCDVFDPFAHPSITSKRCTVIPDIPINSFAVWNASSTGDNSGSKPRMAIMILNMAFLPVDKSAPGHLISVQAVLRPKRRIENAFTWTVCTT
jgi:hypothetical protein